MWLRGAQDVLSRRLSVPSVRIALHSSGPTLPLPRRKHMGSTSGGAAELRKLSCAGACKGDTPKLTHEELAAELRGLPSWEASEDQTRISRKFVAKNFVAAIAFFEEVKTLAEAEGHHPDLHLTSYRNVQVDLQTHSIGGVAKPDLIMAAKIDTLPVTYSPKWLRESGSNQPKLE